MSGDGSAKQPATCSLSSKLLESRSCRILACQLLSLQFSHLRGYMATTFVEHGHVFLERIARHHHEAKIDPNCCTNTLCRVSHRRCACQMSTFRTCFSASRWMLSVPLHSVSGWTRLKKAPHRRLPKHSMLRKPPWFGCCLLLDSTCMPQLARIFDPLWKLKKAFKVGSH